jgi:hypothetical protein
VELLASPPTMGLEGLLTGMVKFCRVVDSHVSGVSCLRVLGGAVIMVRRRGKLVAVR